MTNLTSVTASARLISTGREAQRKYNRFAVWRELALGKKPFWWRVMLWSQRRNAV